MREIVVHAPGDADVLQYEETDEPSPAPGQVVVRNHAVGVNFIDVYRRTGAYAGAFPSIPGTESAGVVAAVGEGVSGIRVGDRVASAAVRGAYAEFSAVDADQVVAIPDAVTFEDAAAVLLQGMTAHYLTFDTFPLEIGETALVHAAAGGVGHLLVQIASKQRGAIVIGTVSTAEKAEYARSCGAAYQVNYSESDVVEEVRRITEGRGVDVVYDSVGRDTFEASLACLRPRGMLVLYGQSSGAVQSFDPQVLNSRGSLFLTRPKLADYTRDASELCRRAGDLFRWLASGELQVRVDRSWPLADATEAHRYLEGRGTRGKLLLIPG